MKSNHGKKEEVFYNKYKENERERQDVSGESTLPYRIKNRTFEGANRH